jgi:ABC-type methionine transport system ATPase subunit
MPADKLAAESLSFSHRIAADGGGPRRPVLQDVSFGVRPGEVFGVIGPSGSGKTTLLRLLNGLESPDRGRVLVDGVDVLAGDVLDLRRKVGMVFQAPALFPGRVGDNVRYPLAILGLPGEEQDCRGRAALEQVGLSAALWERSAADLSQGEQQRVSIARAIVGGPEVLLMDEPTSALDPTSSSRVLTVVRSLNRDLGVTIVFVTHLMEQAREICDRALVLVGGRVVEGGDVPALFDAPTSELTRRFIAGELTSDDGAPGEPPAACAPRGEGMG